MSTKQPQRRQHIPQRTCVVCRTKADKRTLTRIVRVVGGVQLDSGGKMQGRGAYLCDNVSCWERALKTEILNKALQTKLTDADRERLQQAIPRSVS